MEKTATGELMNMADEKTMPTLFCPKHPTVRLIFALKGGAGYCTACSLYVQALGVEMPKLDQPRKAESQAKVAKRQKTQGRRQRSKKRAISDVD